MQYKADVQHPDSIWRLLTPEVHQRLASQIADLTEEEYEAVNRLEETLSRGKR